MIIYLILLCMCVQQNLMCRQTYDDFKRRQDTKYIGNGYVSYCYDNVGLSMCYENCLRSEFCGAIEHDKESMLCKFLSVFNETDTSFSETKSIITAKEQNTVSDCGSSVCELGQFCQTLSSKEKICVDVMKTCNTTHYLVSGPHGVSDEDVSFSSALCNNPTCEEFRLDAPGSWLPLNNILGQWIQVVFKSLKAVVGIVIQQRYGGGQWVSKYHLMYLCGESTHWEYIKNDANERKIFRGNAAGVIKKTSYLDHTIFTKGVRILPRMYYGWMALRFDVLGC